jgi:hypothetical protein
VHVREIPGVGFEWVSPEPDFMGRASCALVADRGVWLVDPVDFPELDERVRALGEPRGVIQLLDRHNRDSAAVATRLNVPHVVTPTSLPGSPFVFVAVPAMKGWREVALWWEAAKTLVVAEAVGTPRYYCAPGRVLGVHPVLRIVRPPKVLLQFAPEHLLFGHGFGLNENATAALRTAISRSRRELPFVLPRLLAAKRHPYL